MTFHSWQFLLFYPLVALLYFVLPRKWKWPMLLAASYFFYMCYRADLVVLILFTTFVSWGMSMLTERTESKARKRLYLAVTLTVCLGVLFFFKYFDFLSLSAYSLIHLFGVEASPLVLNLALPVGISFYTFQTLSYVIDVYRGDIRCERNFFFYALFVSFFPQLVAGPIERPGNLLPQLKQEHRWNRDDAIKGAKHMLVGFFKKIVVADGVAVYVDAVYNHPSDATALSVLVATLLFSVQIYCDFSGYSDIAIGCSRIMGIRLMQNFDHPYRSRSIREFWSRWHISLSGWLKDYLYLPLGGSRVSCGRFCLNIMIVFLASGLWHGASFTFVVWGALHGLYRIVGSLSEKHRDALWRRMGFSTDHVLVRSLRTLGTFALVSFAWIFFRAASLPEAGILIGKLFGAFSGGFASLGAIGLGTVPILSVILSIVLLTLLDEMLVYGDGADGSAVLVRDGAFVYWIWTVLIAWALLLSKGIASAFIYFQF